MEKIFFDDETFIWKTKLNLLTDREFIVKEALDYVNNFKGQSPFDGFGYKREWTEHQDFDGEFEVENKLDLICNIGMQKCKELWNTESKKPYNKINTETWINVVRSKNPKQPQFQDGVDKYHVHTDISRVTESFVPNYTYVYYIQMPDVMNGDDGVLYIKGKDEKEYWIRPEVDDLIIMEGWIPHAPMNAPESTIDRIVMAGNVGFDMIKKEKSLL